MHLNDTYILYYVSLPYDAKFIKRQQISSEVLHQKGVYVDLYLTDTTEY